jgi:putative ABC transport system substrate-binding protein
VLAEELVRLPVDLIVASGSAAIRAAMGATRTIPIVFPASADPVQSGHVDSLARPGRNATGLSLLGPQVTGKRLELLREMVPGLARVMFLTETAASESAGNLQEAREAARLQGVQLLEPDVRTAEDLPAALQVAAAQAQALLPSGTALITRERAQIVGFAVANRLPLMSADRFFTEAGGLASYGTNRLSLYHRAATYVDKILKGANPAELPVEQPTDFEFVVNLTTARAIGMTIPPSVLQQANEIIQ